MIIEKIDNGLYLLRLSPGSLEPEVTPLVNSLLRVFKCPAGYLIEHVAGEHQYDGYYVCSRVSKLQHVENVDTVVRNKDIVIYNLPGQITIVISPIVNDLFKHIIDNQ